MPTRSPRAASALACLALATTALATTAQAHEPGADTLPAAPGWQLGAAVALTLPEADERWPVARWPGVLLQGSAPQEQRGGLRLEHGTAELGLRLNRHLGAQLAVGWHDRDSAHVEAARLAARWPLSSGELLAGVGRDTVRLGAVDHGQLPLAKRAAFDSGWVDGGLSLGWRAAEGSDGLRAAEAGVWRGRVFPGGPAGPAVPSLHLHGGWGHVDAHMAVAQFRPRARGAALQTVGSEGHLHGTPDCRPSLQQLVCFDGRVDLLAASLQWEPEGSDLTLALAGLLRRERGALYASGGEAALRSELPGAWADLAWRWHERWQLAGRLERLVPKHHLEGSGTALLARDAGLAGAGPVERATLALLHEPLPGVQVALEAGRERYAGGEVNHVALRLLWRETRLLGGTW
jgi:hypothetical protein